MSIPTDACFTNVDVTHNIICNDQVLVDPQRNIWGANVVECNTLRYRNLEAVDGASDTRSLFFTEPQPFLSSNEQDPLLERLYGEDNVYTEEIGAVAIGGQFNEASGEYSVCLGGKYNESAGKDAVVVGGRENQAHGDCSLSMGTSALATHDRTFVWNSDVDVPAETTADNQFMVGGNLLFKLPESSTIKTHMVPEGYACWCWDVSRNTLCLKTKQKNIFYKTNMETLVHEIKVNIDGTSVTLVNPDDS
jgi:hypothetical protein